MNRTSSDISIENVAFCQLEIYNMCSKNLVGISWNRPSFSLFQESVHAKCPKETNKQGPATQISAEKWRWPCPEVIKHG